ncbi:MAG: hypothetical protein WCH41_02875 [Methylophilaceae bacterium]|jgi:hypothetical protein
MKRYLILLVILNVAIFAYFKLIASASVNTHEALPDLHPEKVHLLSPKELEALHSAPATPPEPILEQVK